MQDDFAPRPKCRCVAEKSISAVLLAGLLVVVVLAWNMWRERDSYRDALEISRRVVDERNATIDQQERIIAAWVEAHPPTDGELEEGKMGARIIPQVRDLTREANEAVIEVREFVRDVKEGRLGAHVEGSLWHGTADVTLRKVP